MLIKSIKQQTLLLLLSLTLGLALMFFSLALVTAFIVEDSVLSNLLDKEAINIERHYALEGNLPPLSGNFLEVFLNIETVPEWAQKRVKRDQLDGEIFTQDGTHYHYRKLVLGEGRVGYLLAEVSELLAVTNQPDIFALFLFVFFIAIAFAFFLAVKFSQRIVNPVLKLTAAVKANELPATNVPLPQLEFELGYLSEAMQGSFDKLNRLLEREAAFATNVSHELRTPLTVIKNSYTLILQRGFKTEDLFQIRNSCEQMEHIVEVLLALARAESLAFQACNITAALEHAILRCQLPSLEQLHLAIPQNLIMQANPKLLELLFINLLRNATEHASEPGIMVTEVAGKLIFENKAKELQLPEGDITKAGAKGSYSIGVGQGLYLVARIVESFGWQLTIENTHQHFRVIISPI